MRWGRGYKYNTLGLGTEEWTVDTLGGLVSKYGSAQYDFLGRVDSVYMRSTIDTTVSSAQRWWYDANGKWDSTRINTTRLSFTYESGTSRLASKTTNGLTQTFDFDQWGNMTYDQSKGDTYVYDSTTGEMIQVWPFGQGTHLDYITIGYDALGRKVRETYVDWYLDDCGPPDPPDSFGGEGEAEGPAECWEVRSFNKYYIWSGASVVAEYDDNNTLLNNFAYAGGVLLARFKTLTDTASIGYIFGDRSGSSRSVVPKSNPATSWREADYGAFGNIIKEQATSPDNCNYLYTGKEWYSDHGINLYYYGARWYDPSIGRFTQTDPVHEYSNAYSLALNNPIALSDAWGLTSIEKIRAYDPRAGQSRMSWGATRHFDPADRMELLLNDVPVDQLAWVAPSYQQRISEPRPGWRFDQWEYDPSVAPGAITITTTIPRYVTSRSLVVDPEWVYPGTINGIEVTSNPPYQVTHTIHPGDILTTHGPANFFAPYIAAITDAPSHAVVVLDNGRIADYNSRPGGGGHIYSPEETDEYFEQNFVASIHTPPSDVSPEDVVARAYAYVAMGYSYESPIGLIVGAATGIDVEPLRYMCFEFAAAAAGPEVARGQHGGAFIRALETAGWTRVAYYPWIWRN